MSNNCCNKPAPESLILKCKNTLANGVKRSSKIEYMSKVGRNIAIRQIMA